MFSGRSCRPHLMVVALFAATVVAPVHDQSKVQADHKHRVRRLSAIRRKYRPHLFRRFSPLYSSRGSSQARDGVAPPKSEPGWVKMLNSWLGNPPRSRPLQVSLTTEPSPVRARIDWPCQGPAQGPGASLDRTQGTEFSPASSQRRPAVHQQGLRACPPGDRNHLVRPQVGPATSRVASLNETKLP